MALSAETIHKSQTLRPPNLEDHGTACEAFSWAQARRAIDDSLEGKPGFNMATLAVDRHAHSPHAAKLALRWLGKAGGRRDLTYAELSQLSPTCCKTCRWTRAITCSCCAGVCPSSMWRCSAHSSTSAW